MVRTFHEHTLSDHPTKIQFINKRWLVKIVFLVSLGLWIVTVFVCRADAIFCVIQLRLRTRVISVCVISVRCDSLWCEYAIGHLNDNEKKKQKSRKQNIEFGT